MVDTKELNKIIKDSGIKKKKLYETLELSYGAFKRRINNEVPFTFAEVETLCEMLGITESKKKLKLFFCK